MYYVPDLVVSWCANHRQTFPTHALSGTASCSCFTEYRVYRKPKQEELNTLPKAPRLKQSAPRLILGNCRRLGFPQENVIQHRRKQS